MLHIFNAFMSEKPIIAARGASEVTEAQWLVLLRRVAELEQRIAALETRTGPTTHADDTPAISGQAASKDLESRFASPLLNYLGLIAMLVGLSLLIGYWMEAHSIAAILLACSSGALLAGLAQWMHRRGAQTFSETLEGTALGLIFIACYLSYSWGGILLSLGTAAVVIALAIHRAVQRNSQFVLLFVFLAALLGTLLLRSASSGQSLVFGYLAAINAGAVWVGGKKGWIGLRFLALIGSHVVAWFWYWTHPSSQLALTFLFPVLTFALFARFVPRGPLIPAECWLAVMNSGAFLVAAASLLRVHGPACLPWTALALAILHVCIAIAWTPVEALRPSARLHWWLGVFLFAGGIGAAALVLPPSYVALLWTAEAVILGWTGIQRNNAAWRNLSNLLALSAALAVQFAIRSSTEAAAAVTASALAFAVWVTIQHSLTRRRELRLGNWEWATYWMLAVAATILPMLALGRQISTPGGGVFESPLATSAAWAIYSMAVCLAGWFWVSPFLRWTGVALLLVTTLKVFLFDPATLSGITRIVSFLLLSAVLLLLSYLFQRRRS
ncbi:MAG: DUF2339 domain-containing protein [Acidobacteria bacterium]|nr:DUF2339 domain-containing protein [Acidobacteriota bacterium]